MAAAKTTKMPPTSTMLSQMIFGSCRMAISRRISTATTKAYRVLKAAASLTAMIPP